MPMRDRISKVISAGAIEMLACASSASVGSGLDPEN